MVLALCALGFVVPSAQAAFPGQNGQIAFQRFAEAAGGPNWEIFTMNPDGTLQLNRTNHPASDTAPAFSPDGSRIAFVSDRDGNAEIYVMNADGSAQTRLTNNASLDNGPAFSRDGKRIVFVSNRDGNAEIYAMSAANGGNLTRLTTTTRSESAPAFSPDGSKIAFAWTGPGVGGLSVINANGTGETALTSTRSDANPDFSPDATKVVFEYFGEVYTINADGTGPRTNVSNRSTVEENPVFSPDGTKIAFGRHAGSVVTEPLRGIYTMNADGSEQTYRSLFPVKDEFAADTAPSWGVTPASADKTPPETTITSGPSGATNDDTPTFEFSSSEPKSSFECRVDAAAFASCESPHTTAALSDGAHTFEVRATDVAGNTDPSPASRAFSVNTAGSSDTTPPQTTISSGPAGPTNVNTPTFAFGSDEEGSTFQCRVDSEAFASCSSPHTTAPLSDGAHTFEVRATDAAGNADPTPASRSFTVDTAAPETTISSGPAQGSTTSDTTPTFAFSSSESGSSFECRVDSAAFAACSSPHTTAPLGEGAHTFEVRATDAAGNTDGSPARRTFTVDSRAPADTRAPQTTITAGPEGTTNDNTPTFAFSSDEAGSTFACRVDDGAFAPCSSPHTTAPLSDGAHTFGVRATDAAGNTDPSPATRAFTVDTTGQAATPATPAGSSGSSGSSGESTPGTGGPSGPGGGSGGGSGPSSGGPAADTTRPLISGLSLAKARFRARGSRASSRGTTIAYRLSEPARVVFGVERAVVGRRAGGRCAKPTRANRRARRCTRYVAVRGTFAHEGKAADNTLRFTGRVGGRTLSPGRYRLRAVASDAAGNRSTASRTSFRVVR